MRAYCYICQADTIIGSSGRCGFCETVILSKHTASTVEHVGSHSYIGDEAFYEKAHARYLELKSLRATARELYQEAGYRSAASLANTLHEVFIARGWPTFTRGYSQSRHGKLRRDYRDPAYRRAQRIKRGEIRGVRCAAMTISGKPCAHYALSGDAYCYQHHPANRHQILGHLEGMRAARKDRS